MIDGCSRWKALLHIALPLSLPGLIATATYIFIVAWNEYMFAVTFISHDELKTLQVGLAGLKTLYANTWADILAGAVIAAVPVILLFLIFQRFIVKGLTAGAVKG